MNKREMALTIQHIVDDPHKTDMQKLTTSFGQATEAFISTSENDLALARAMGDTETAVKEQIKANVMRAAREIFADCYVRVSGQRSEVWDE
jgi:hypothetical protein